MKVSRIIVSLFLFCAACASSSAQYVRPTTGGTMREFNFNNPMSALAATMVMNKAREDALAKRLGRQPSSAQNSGNRSTTGVQSQSAPAKIDESVLRFRSTGTYLKTKELADGFTTDPAQRETCLKIMNGVLDAFGQKTQALGLSNDIAAALAFFFGENIRIYRGAPELPDQQYLNMRKMIAGALTAGNAFANATDRQKQGMYEILVASTGFTQFAYEQAMAANRSDLAKTYQQVAGSNLHSLTNMSPDSLNLTNDGLTVATDNSNANPQTSSGSVPASGGAVEIRQQAADFRENLVRSNQLYQGKRIIATGSVSRVETFEGKPALICTQDVLIPDVICYLAGCKPILPVAQFTTGYD